MATILEQITENWAVWFVTTVLIVAAIIDGAILKVPNWLTFPFIVGGWMHCTLEGGMAGLGWSLVGTCVGMCLLLFLRNVGGMGAGDVKLLAGIGAWLGTTTTLYAFAATAIVGGVMAVVMVMRKGEVNKHIAMGHQILSEWKTAGSAKELSGIARERKPNMMLLPYGIPMAIGSIAYFAFAGLLI
ncbi:MAG: A24 family peptidase [Rubripirellula sp.]